MWRLENWQFYYILFNEMVVENRKTLRFDNQIVEPMVKQVVK